MHPTDDAKPRRTRGIVFQLAAVALCVVSAFAATGLARWLRTPPSSKPAAGAFPAGVLKGWEKPDLVLVLTGQQHGYLEPCGCSAPQVGGLERRYNFIQMMKRDGWPVVALDLGDVPQKKAPAYLPNKQGMIKYAFSMKAMKLMGYDAVGFGEYEVNLGLFNVLTEFALNETQPRVISTNLMGAKKNFDDMVAPWQPRVVHADGSDVKVGVAAITSPQTATSIKKLTNGDAKVLFADSKLTLDNLMKQFDDSKVELPVLLYQGPLRRGEEPETGAVGCAEAFPRFRVVLCASDEDDPPMKPHEWKTKAGETNLVVNVGHKGKFIGVVGAWRRKGGGFDLRYERVEMSVDFLTPKAEVKDHPVFTLMENYTAKLRDDKYLESYGKNPMSHSLQVVAGVKPGQVAYAGSEACKKCHDHAYGIWESSDHAHAYKTLTDPDKVRNTNRQYDPECIVCHTVGFGYQSGFVTEETTPKLKDVGCESCHGPSSMHVALEKANKNKAAQAAWRAHINPWRQIKDKKRRTLAIDQMCQKCHDQENDVHWTGKGFEKKYPKVDHSIPEEGE